MIISWDRFIELISGNRFIFREERSDINIRNYDSLYKYYKDDELVNFQVYINSIVFDIQKYDNKKILVKDGVINLIMRNFMSKVTTQLVLVKGIEFMGTEEIKQEVFKNMKTLNKEQVCKILTSMEFNIGETSFNVEGDPRVHGQERDGELYSFYFWWMEGRESHEGDFLISQMDGAKLDGDFLYLKEIEGNVIEFKIKGLGDKFEEWEAYELAMNQGKRDGRLEC